MWRREMEVQLSAGKGNLMGLMFVRNRVGAWRDKLAPEEWFSCPSCRGRGLWVDQGGRNCYCVRCSGTGLLLVCEQDKPKPSVPAQAGWWSWLCKRSHVVSHEDEASRGRS